MPKERPKVRKYERVSPYFDFTDEFIDGVLESEKQEPIPIPDDVTNYCDYFSSLIEKEKENR